MKIIYIVLISLIPFLLHSQETYKLLIDQGEIEKGTLAYFEVSNIEAINIYGNYRSLVYESSKSLEDTAKNGNLAALLFLAEITPISNIDLVFNSYEDSILYKKNKLFTITAWSLHFHRLTRN
jgi:hypothetical protein